MLNNTDDSIVMALHCHAEISRLLLLRYDLQKKTYQQSPWAANTGIYFYLHYDSRRQHLFGLREASALHYTMEEYNTTTLEVIQEYAKQNASQYGFPCEGCAIFDPDENWMIEIRMVSKGQYEHAYFLKMDLNLVGQQKNIVTEFQDLSKLVCPYTMTYDTKTKLIIATWERGLVATETVMLHLNPYTARIQNETPLLKTPFGWSVHSVQALFDESTRQVLYLIKQTDIQQLRIVAWSITVDFDTLKIVETKQVTTLLDLDAWTFFKEDH